MTMTQLDDKIIFNVVRIYSSDSWLGVVVLYRLRKY